MGRMWRNIREIARAPAFRDRNSSKRRTDRRVRINALTYGAQDNGISYKSTVYRSTRHAYRLVSVPVFGAFHRCFLVVALLAVSVGFAEDSLWLGRSNEKQAFPCFASRLALSLPHGRRDGGARRRFSLAPNNGR